MIQTFFAIFLGSFLGSLLFPTLLKRNDRLYENKCWARETFYESISKINFHIKNHERSKFEDKFSMSDLSESHIEKEIFKDIRNLHKNSYKINLYLSRKDRAVFNIFLKESREAFDEAKSTYGCWAHDDSIEKEAHSDEMLYNQKEIAVSALEKLKLPK